MNFEGAKKYIIDRLINEASSKLYYHGLHHTLDVHNAAEKLAGLEAITGEELILLKTAALFHDIGFLEQYINNEAVAVKIAKQVLPQYGYNERQVEIIAGLIMATDIARMPCTHLEKILCDADLDYLGRDDFSGFAEQLRRELHVHGYSFSDRQWDEIQVKFLEKHSFHTASAKKMRDETKQKHLEKIKERLKKDA